MAARTRVAVAAAIVSCAFSNAGVAVLAAEGVFILGYLLAAGAPPGLTVPGRWLRRQAVLLVAGLIATGAVLAAYAVRPADSVWLALAVSPPRSLPISSPCDLQPPAHRPDRLIAPSVYRLPIYR